MSAERTLWNYVRKGLRGRWVAQRHEDKYSAGVPDVSYAVNGADGWIELKALDRWPVKEGTPVRVGITPEQVAWLETRGDVGAGRCFVLIRVGREHILVRWHRCRSLLRVDLSPVDIRHLAEITWERGIDWDDLVWYLMKEGNRR